MHLSSPSTSYWYYTHDFLKPNPRCDPKEKITYLKKCARSLRLQSSRAAIKDTTENKKGNIQYLYNDSDPDEP